MFDPYPQRKGFGLYKNSLIIEQVKNVAGRVACRQYDSQPGKRRPILANDPFDFLVPENKVNHFGIKMYFAAGIQNALSQPGDNQRKFVSANVRVGIYQNIFAGAMRYKYF